MSIVTMRGINRDWVFNVIHETSLAGKLHYADSRSS